jgi:hypothetical protein
MYLVDDAQREARRSQLKEVVKRRSIKGGGGE